MMNQTAVVNQVREEYKVNNLEKRIKTANLLEIMEERKSRRFDRYDSLGTLYENVRCGDLIMTENATNQFFNKINLDRTLGVRLSPSVWDKVIQECVAEVDSKNKLNGLIRYEKNHEGKTIVRAVLSKDYAVLDSLPIISAAKSLMGDEVIIRDYIDDDKSTRLSIVLGDPIHLGTIDGKPDVYFNIMTINNSETGNKSLSVNMGLWRMWCFNGAMNPVNQFGDNKIRHYGDKNQVFGSIQDLNASKLIESNLKIVDMYKNSKGIYVSRAEAEKIYDTYVEKAGLPKKLIEAAKTLKVLKYKDSADPSIFNIYNSVTEAIHRQTPNIHTRFEREADAYMHTEKIVEAYIK